MKQMEKKMNRDFDRERTRLYKARKAIEREMDRVVKRVGREADRLARRRGILEGRIS